MLSGVLAEDRCASTCQNARLLPDALSLSLSLSHDSCGVERLRALAHQESV